jgi:hypothetical protein
MSRIDQLSLRLGGISLITNEKAVRAKSRDFFWYSPVLKDALDHVTAQAVVMAQTEDDVVRTLAACFELDIPVTPRGSGTGNYGQAMPIAGGVVLDTSLMNAITRIDDGVLICGPGALMGDIETATLAATRQELRMHPSTRETASIGGFIAGGSGGVGSVRWGMLHEPGNIRSVRIATMEARPRLIDLTGLDINNVHHAYGVTGVITEVEMPLVKAENWVEILLTFDDWQACVAAGWDILDDPDVILKQLAAIQTPAPYCYFVRHRKFLQENSSLLCVLVADRWIESFLALTAGRCVYRSDTASDDDKKRLPHLHHLCWNHTTLRALKIDPEVTYLQLGTRDGDEVNSITDVAKMFPDEIINHVEFTRSQGKARASMLPLLRYHSKLRMDMIVAQLADIGILNWNPHAYTLEEGNHRNPDPSQIALKRENDPKGLLNPGKLIGWDNPDYIYDMKGGYHAPQMQVKPCVP